MTEIMNNKHQVTEIEWLGNLSVSYKIMSEGIGTSGDSNLFVIKKFNKCEKVDKMDKFLE